MVRVTLVDTGTGNLFSLREAFRRAGAEALVTRDPAKVARAEVLVLPGVASFPAAVRGLAGLRAVLLDRVAEGAPLLGVCAGMQVLFASSDEGAGEGLGLLDGRVEALRARVVPHMGWSSLHADGDAWFRDLPRGAMAYFAHSYAVPARCREAVATAIHGEPFAAAVRRWNVFGVQFHPEKSGSVGAAVLRGFLREAGVGP